MNAYKFETSDLGISDEGLHLLRSGYNYKTLPFTDIYSIKLSKGRLTKNWKASFIFGSLLLLLGIYSATRLFVFFNSPGGGSIYIQEVLIPLFPFLTGVYCLYISLQKGEVLVAEVKGKKETFPVTAIEKKGELPDLKNFLQERTRLLN
jgi:hypothetical protein